MHLRPVAGGRSQDDGSFALGAFLSSASERHRGPSAHPLLQAPYPSLMALRHDAALAAAYDRAWRAWEQSSPFAQQLCREVAVLQHQLAQQRHAERQLKATLEAAREQLEAGLMEGLDGGGLDRGSTPGAAGAAPAHEDE